MKNERVNIPYFLLILFNRRKNKNTTTKNGELVTILLRQPLILTEKQPLIVMIIVQNDWAKHLVRNNSYFVVLTANFRFSKNIFLNLNENNDDFGKNSKVTILYHIILDCIL